jgi:hypothetical protein
MSFNLFLICSYSSHFWSYVIRGRVCPSTTAFTTSQLGVKIQNGTIWVYVIESGIMKYNDNRNEILIGAVVNRNPIPLTPSLFSSAGESGARRMPTLKG